MLEFLATDLLWWHWVVFGIILITLEIFVGTFMLLGLGLAAMIVGEVDNIFDITLASELMLWIVLSLISIAIWFKYLKDHTVERSGQSDYALGAEGIVQEAIQANSRGKVKFDTPILGNTLWHATAKEEINIGQRVKIINVRGQLIEVEKI